MITPKEQIEQRRKNLKHGAGNAAVLLCALAGVMLADPWQMYRRGEVPVFVGPENFLELIFSVILGVGMILGVQELGGSNPGQKHKRLLKRCITGFIGGAGARVMIG